MSKSSSDRPTVLIVEDQEPLAEVYADFLADDYDVTIALNGEAALDVIDDSVDLVLLDRRMPGQTGDEVIKELNQRGYGGPIVLVTAITPDFEIVELGFDNYLVKPVDRDDLLKVVNQTLDQATYEARIREYYGLSSKQSRLEAIYGPDSLDDHEEYQQLCDRLAEIRGEIDSILSGSERPEFTALIERTHTMAVLQESEERYRSLTEDVLDTSDVGTVIVGPTGHIEWVNRSIETYFGLDRDDVLRDEYQTVVTRTFVPLITEPEGYEQRVIQALEDNRSVTEFRCHVDDGSGEERWLKHWSKPIETGLYAGGRIEHYYDVTPLVENQQTLDALHEATREQINATTREAVCERTIEAGTSILDADRAAIYLRDESTGELAIVEGLPAPQADGLPAQISPGEDNVIWESFVQERVLEHRSPGEEAPTAGYACSFLLPLGNHGVLLLGYEQEDAVPTTGRKFAQILAANVEVTLDRTARERALRDRDQQLKAQNEQLQRLNRINAVIRNISQALLAASTKREIVNTVCERLASIDSFTFVWVGEPDFVKDALRPMAMAGSGDSYLETILTDADLDTDRLPPAWAVAETIEPVVENNIIDTAVQAPWHSNALTQGFQSVAAIPIEYDGSLLAVLEIYSSTPSLFSEAEQSVLTELGQTIGHAINAIERRDALIANASIELEFEITGVDDFFSRLAASDLGGVVIRSVIPQGDGSTTAFFALSEGTTEEVSAVIDQSPDVSNHALISEDDDSKLFRCTLTGSTMVTRVADHGGHPRSIQAQENGCRFIVAVPQSTDVRAFSDRLEESGYDVKLVARRERDGKRSVTGPLNERIEKQLTDRQREVLRSAYFSGYFDWPRVSSGQEIADAIGIDQSTLQQHLRAGQRHVFEALFDRF